MMLIWTLLALIWNCRLLTTGALTLNVKMAVAQEKYLVQYETVLELNCTAKLLRESSDENTYNVTLKLQDENGGVLKDSKPILMPTMRTSFTDTIRYGVKYTSKAVQQRFICKCEATGPSVHIKKDELNVVFEDAPSIPENIGGLYHDNQLVVYSSSNIPNLIVRRGLETKYSMQIIGATSCEKTFHSNYRREEQCNVTKSNEKDVLFCVMDDIEKYVGVCYAFHVLIMAQNRFGNVHTERTFLKVSKPLLKVKSHQQSDSEIILELNSQISNDVINKVEYEMRYWTEKKDKKEYWFQDDDIGSIVLPSLKANHCYNVSIKSNICFPIGSCFKTRLDVNQLYCTRRKVIEKSPTDFMCQVIQQNTRKSPAIVELKWMKPTLNKSLYGNIESYRLTIEFVNKPYYHLVNYSILPTSKEYEIFTSNLNGYKDGGRVTYTVATCNTAGCSANTSKCSLYIREAEFVSPRTLHQNISLTLACILPTIAIVALVTAGCASYYRNKSIQEELLREDSNSLEDLSNTRVDVRSNSYSKLEVELVRERPVLKERISFQSIGGSSEILDEKSAKEEAEVNSNVTSINRNELARLFVRSLQSKVKARNEDLLNNSHADIKTSL